jgi:EmrB/QacA subfamily drug resistance transporter
MSRYLIFVVIGSAVLMQNMGGYAASVAFPDISATFNASIVLTAWVLSVYPLATIITIPLSGKASDALGRKRTFMFFVLLYAVGSLLCAVAPNVYWLIFFRIVQGMGSGGFMTSAVGIIADTFPESRQRYIGLLTSIGTVGIMFGLNVGGWLTETFGWRSIFWFAAAGSMAACAVGIALLKPDGKLEKVSLDVKGAAVFAAALGALMLGLTSIKRDMAERAWVMAGGAVILGVALIVVFLRRERKVKNPMIDLEVLQGRQFSAANIFNAAFGMMIGVSTLLPLYAVTVYGMSTVESGLIVTPRTLTMFAASIICSFMMMRWGYRKPMIVGTAITILACSLFGFEAKSIGFLGLTLSGVAIMVAVVALSGLGQGISAPASNNACIELLPERVSTIIGVRSTFRHAGQSFGIALASIVLAGVGTLDQGFRFVFFGTALLGLITIPCIFIMPASPLSVPADRAAKAARHAGAAIPVVAEQIIKQPTMSRTER